MKRISRGMILLLLACGSANAALLSRAGGQAYYDDVLDITWLANANLADTNDFGVAGINANGSMTWSTAQSWIGAMNAANYLGTNTWRLPTVEPLNGSTFNYTGSYNGSTDAGSNQSEQGTAYAGSTGSEMAHLFYNTLNNKGYCDPLLSTGGICSSPQAGWGLSNVGPFSNFQSKDYWSGTEYAPNTSYAWRFNFFDGNQNMGGSKASHMYSAWAVRSGDIAPVPVPGAIWLFGGAVGLLGYVRRNLN
jgi:Protein of unknown function (DUF1566)